MTKETKTPKAKAKKPATKVRSFSLAKETPKTDPEKDAAALRKALKELQVSEFIKYLRSPWRIMWHNFLAGVFRGLGLIVVMTVVFAVIIWFLAGLVDFPLIGRYFEDLKNMLEQFAEIEVPKWWKMKSFNSWFTSC